MDLVTPTDVPLSTYLAVQMLPTESPLAVAGAICQAGHDRKTLFRRLEVLDVTQIANNPFLRVRSDVLNPHPILEALFAQQRGYVVAGAGGQYSVRLPDGRTGPVQGATMHTPPKPGCHRMFRGPRIKMFERQFLTD